MPTPTPSPDALKEVVRTKYRSIAEGTDSCCGPDADLGLDVSEDYADAENIAAEADLDLGCGLPTQYADLQPGERVLDLGSGAGMDAFVARRDVGAEGHVHGVDMTEEMVSKARANAEKLGHENVTFAVGDIEDLPVDDASFDVILSNCVLNLVPDKERAFGEMARVLRPGGASLSPTLFTWAHCPTGCGTPPRCTWGAWGERWSEARTWIGSGTRDSRTCRGPPKRRLLSLMSYWRRT